MVYEVSSTQALHESVVPFFERYVVPFSCKTETFERFREIVEMMIRKEHRSPEGLAQVVRLAYEMNPAGKEKARLRPLDDVVSRILRGHTSDTLEAA